MKIKTSITLFLPFVIFLFYNNAYSQGDFPITAEIGYAAALGEVKTHFSVPGAVPGSPGDPYSNQVASGSYSIYYAANNTSGKIIRPIIIVEGFDPTDQYSTDDVIELLNGDNTSFDDVATNLRTQGYDLIVLDYDDGGQLIQRNAFLLIKLIQHINKIKNSTCPIILAGYSMGGIVSRYALNYMEAHALPHKVGLFFSFDSPQRGANIPMAMQDMVNWLDNNVATYGLSVDIQTHVRSIHSYAAQQMLIYHTDYRTGDIATVSPAFTTFYNQMKALVSGNGYPSNCKKIAASLGNWTGLGQAYMNPANQWVDHIGTVLPTNPMAFSFTGASNAPFVGYALAGGAAPLPYNITVPFSGLPFAVMFISVASAIFTSDHQTGYYNAPIPADVMPGSFTPIFKDVAESLNGFGVNSNIRMPNGCFIPTVSALDFETNSWYHNIAADPDRLSKTPFASIFATVDNFDHKLPLSGHYALADWILNEVSIFNATVPACEAPPLPVTLVSFNADKEDKIALLNWRTTAEINFDHFEVERSLDGKNWFVVGKVFPGTESKLENVYTFKDESPLPGINYYRLKMLDKDDSFAYSILRDIKFEDFKIIIFPNPIGSDGKLQLAIGDNKISKVIIYNQAGNEVFYSVNQDLNINLKSLPKGRYIIKIQLQNGIESNQIIIKE